MPTPPKIFKTFSDSGPDDDQPLCAVNGKWTGLGKEMFTSADTYVLSISEPNLVAAPPLVTARSVLLQAIGFVLAS